MKNSFSSLSDLASAFGKNKEVETNNNQHTPSSHSSESSTHANKSANDNLVYSTESGRITKAKQSTITPSDGFARVRRETKGRKGKGVITISGLGLDAAALKNLAKKLKKTCGTGGSVVSEVIEIQGDQRDTIKALLEKEGFKVKFIGG